MGGKWLGERAVCFGGWRREGGGLIIYENIFCTCGRRRTKRYEKTKKKKRRDVMMLVYHLIVARFACGLSLREEDGPASTPPLLFWQAL